MGAAIATAAAAEDRRSHLLRNVHTGPLALVALIGFAAAAGVGEQALAPLDLVAGTAIFAGPWLLSFLISPTSIGFGDVKYAAALGLYLGWLGPATARNGLLLACAIGGLVALWSIIRRRRGDAFPFGPSLLAGAVLAVAIEIGRSG